MEVKRPVLELPLKSPDFGFFDQARNYSNELFAPNFLRSNDASNETFLSPAQFGCLTGLLIILFSKYQIDREKCFNRFWFLLSSPSFREFLTITFCFFVFSILFMSSTILIFCSFVLYKKLEGRRLRNNKSANFKGFLNGEDIVWACEDSLSKSIINILAFVRASPDDDGTLHLNLLQSIRDRISTKLMITNRFPKMFYLRRKSDCGYFYWTDENSLTINEYVRLSEHQGVEKLQSEAEFKRRMSFISNEPLPANNSALWECLIGQCAVRVGDDLKYPIIFRVHHSLGDGVALLRLLIEALADKVDFEKTENNPLLSKMNESYRDMMKRFSINLLTFIKTPYVLLRMTLKEIDTNQIHPVSLTGNKKVNWLYESDSNETCPTLLTVVKLLKHRFSGARFSNILLAALSKSLRDFFERKSFDIPKDMTVVIPARLYNNSEDHQLRMENKFSVALQTLPIDILGTNDRVQTVKRYSDIVVASPDYLVNFWMMSIVSAIFPDWILKVILNSKHSTMAISNLPGPNFAIKINGYEFENVGFFLPNIGQTACGITILSYNNKLHFGIMADESAVATEEDLGEILWGMVQELKVMIDNKTC